MNAPPTQQAPSASSSRKRSRSPSWPAPSPPSKQSKTSPSSSPKVVFLELFAGTGGLSTAVAKVIPTLPPQDLQTLGGVDFADGPAVQAWCETLRAALAEFDHVIFHVAPPCSTFSRARDRSHRTRLRSSALPSGWYPHDANTIYGNAIAKNTAYFVDFILANFSSTGTWEQPLGSYMFPYLDFANALQATPTDTVLLHQCRFGRPFKKPTTFACFNGLKLRSLNRQCTTSHSCGRTWHQTLGFGQSSTSAAAEYPPALCRAYAADVAAHVRRLSSITAIDHATVHVDGTVQRHCARGSSDWSQRSIRAAEDAVSRAGVQIKPRATTLR